MKTAIQLGWLVVGLMLAGLTADAQENRLSIEQSPMQPSIQTGRPIPSWWDVKVAGTSLVEGQFEFQLKNEGQLLATLTTEEMALTGPQQRIRVLLPPVHDESPIEQLQVGIKFRGKQFQQDLGSQMLRVALTKLRSMMVLSAASRLANKRSAERRWILGRLQFESLADELDESIKTIPAPLEPSDMPQEPMAYCAYELVILFGEEFRLLKKPQLDALAAWVRAGGSLYLEPTGVLEPYHLEFLKSITAFGPDELIIQPDSTGRLIPGTIWNDERLLSLTNGLGRIVLRIDDEQSEEMQDSAAWREAVAFLWRLHSTQAAIAAADPSIGMRGLVGNRQQFEYPAQLGVNSWSYGFGAHLRTSTAELLDWLMPEGVRMVPLWVLSLLLVSFVIWIGPVDYYGLGWIRARKFTWVTFPLATLLVTAMTVWITNQYMSSAETRRGLVLRDIGDDGATVRVNRFELLFIASSRTVTTEIRKGIFATLKTGRSMADFQFRPQNPYQPRPGYTAMDLNQTHGPLARTTGRIPAEFTVAQDLAKWTPQLNRIFWIPGEKDETIIDWSALTEGISIPEMYANRTISSELQTRVETQFGPDALVACLGANRQWAFSRHEKWWAAGGTHTSSNDARMNQFGYPMLPSELTHEPDLFRWIYQHSIAMPVGLFSLASQIGPSGGEELEDLPILDSSDSRQHLLVVVVPRGDDLIVYRKLLRGGF